MAYIEWTDDYLTGIDVIDDDHKHLFKLINTLNDSAEIGLDIDTIGVALNDLALYVERHFSREESFMENFAYPDLLVHMRGHRSIANQVRSFQTAYEENPGTIGTDKFLEFIRDWLTSHILKSDMAYVPYIKGGGGA